MHQNGTAGIETCTLRISEKGDDEHGTTHHISTKPLSVLPAYDVAQSHEFAR